MTLDELRQALGKVAYERYVEAHDGVTQIGKMVLGLPPWDALDESAQLQWTHIAGAVLDTAAAHGVMVSRAQVIGDATGVIAMVTE